MAGDARRSIESRTGKPIITSQNAAQLDQVVTQMIEGVVAEDKPQDDTSKQRSAQTIAGQALRDMASILSGCYKKSPFPLETVIFYNFLPRLILLMLM